MALTDDIDHDSVPHDQEPLLGSPGDAVQHSKPLYHNFVIGTGVVAQAGIWVLTAIIWGSVLSNDIMLFSAHPLLNSAAALLYVQAALVLQPTVTAKQKRQGTYAHAALNSVAAFSAIAGLIVIEYNKFDHGGTHFVSVHAIMGLTTYCLLLLQAFVGMTQFYTPSLYGGVDNAKALYKFHRVGGYVTLVMLLATICAATSTDFNVDTLKIQLWAVATASVLVVLGLGARIRLNKFGWLAGR